MRVAVLCPTRGRPDLLKRLCESVAKTSKNATVYAYIDDDDQDTYGETLMGHPVPNLRVTVGPRIGPCASANRLIQETDAELLGYVPDDGVFAIPNWDVHMAKVAKGFSNGIGVVSPAHNHGNHVDVPFVTKAWTTTLGWYCYPGFYHWCWPTVIGMLGTAVNAVVRMSPHECYIHHELEPSLNGDKQHQDVIQLYNMCTYERFEIAANFLRRSQQRGLTVEKYAWV